MKKKYKTARKYPCPFCNKRMTRSDMIEHVQDEHEIMIPEDYSAARVVYDHINHKNYGICMVCGSKVYEWDSHVCRYKNICQNNNGKCLAQVKAKARDNHLEDPEIQKKMLEGRKISGKYTFADGTVHSYTGSYEKKAWEFMDTVLHIKGSDLMIPGPVIDYEFEGETHKWILDCLYIPGMLAMDIKDGGSNPNTRPMQSYREKQIAKEEAIAKQGKYNYLRLTDNNFAQLLYAMADIKYSVIEHNPDMGVYINESAVAGVMVGTSKNANTYVTPCIMGGITGDDNPHLVFGNTYSDDKFYYDKDGKPKVLDNENELSYYGERFYFKNQYDLNELAKLNEQEAVSKLIGFRYTGNLSDFYLSENVVILRNEGYYIMNGIHYSHANLKQVAMKENVQIMKNVSTGRYIAKKCNLMTEEYSSISEIPQTAFFDLNMIGDDNSGI